jgi:hypothetical protein
VSPHTINITASTVTPSVFPPVLASCECRAGAVVNVVNVDAVVAGVAVVVVAAAVTVTVPCISA